MLAKLPNPVHKRIFKAVWKTVFVVEAAGFALSYALYYKLNSDRDFRLYMHKNYNFVLEGYYGLGESIGGLKTRDLDYKVWKNEGKF